MRNAIKEYIELSDDKKKELLNTATIVFDTNVLLNLYRYSKETRETLLDIMAKYKDRLWMPYHVAREFMRNRIKTIENTIEQYKLQEEAGKKFIDNCISELRLDQNDKDFQDLKERIIALVNSKKNDNIIVLSADKDSILDTLLALFDGKVGKPYDAKHLDEIEKEGKGRYEQKIPPGYKDKDKIKDNNINNAYGDLIVWYQILDFAKENKKDIIFVTNDQKEDWWYILNGKTIRPRVELIREFSEYTEQNFHMYQIKHFIDILSKQNGIPVDDRIVQEIDSFSASLLQPNVDLLKSNIDELELISLRDRLFEIKENNYNRYLSIKGYEKLMDNGAITKKQMKQMKILLDKFKHDDKKAQEIERELQRLGILGFDELNI